MRADTGLSADVAVQTGSSSGLAVVSRRGLGRHRHVSTRYVCVCAATSAGRQPGLEEEPGDTNVSNALTKPLDEGRVTKLLPSMWYEFRDGRTSLGARGVMSRAAKAPMTGAATAVSCAVSTAAMTNSGERLLDERTGRNVSRKLTLTESVVG